MAIFRGYQRCYGDHQRMRGIDAPGYGLGRRHARTALRTSARRFRHMARLVRIATRGLLPDCPLRTASHSDGERPPDPPRTSAPTPATGLWVKSKVPDCAASRHAVVQHRSRRSTGAQPLAGKQGPAMAPASSQSIHCARRGPTGALPPRSCVLGLVRGLRWRPGRRRWSSAR